MSIKVTLKKISNHGPKQGEIAQQACALLEKAINHPNFKSVLESKKYTETRFRDQNGRAFSVPVNEIYNYIVSGIERGTARDAEIDIEVVLAKLEGDPVGSTYPGKLPFYTSYWFINKCIKKNDPSTLAAHFMHEWLHVSGFYHYPDNGARNDVPWNTGDTVQNVLSGNSANEKSKRNDPSSPAFDLEHRECGATHQNLTEDASTVNRPDLQI